MTEQPRRTGIPTVVKVLLILGLLFLLFAGGLVGVCAYCVASTPELRERGALVGETMRIGMAATKAPGTKELRDAGCVQALAMDMRRLAQLVQSLGKGDADKQSEEVDTVMVMCQVKSAKSAMTCESVARIYGSAVEDPPAELVAVVQIRFPQKTVCQGVYGPDGSKLRDVAQPETSPP